MTLPTKAVLIPYILLFVGAIALGLYLWLTPSALPIYIPGPTSVQKVYETKWKDRVKPVPYLVPTGAVIEFFPQEKLAKASKIPDAPDNTIAFGQVPKHSGNTTIFSTLKMGQDNVLRGGLEYRQEATPFWGWDREFHGGVYYGLVGTNQIEGQIRAKLLRTGPISWGAQGRLGMEKDGGRLNGAILLGIEY
jgi:hypothetical protein